MKNLLGSSTRIMLLDFFRNTNQGLIYNQYLKNQYLLSKQDIDEYQRRKLDEIISYHFRNNPVYRNYLINLGIDSVSKAVISNLPIIRKDFFRNNLNGAVLKKNIHTIKHSGGSTGTPLQVCLSKDTVDNIWPAIWRSFDVLNIRPGDPILMIAGPSLFSKRTLKRKVYDYICNFSILSAFDINEATLALAIKQIRTKKIKAVYGYTSAVLLFLNYLEDKDIYIDLNGIITTSETFIPRIRYLARKYCNCDVIDTYGANDGGIFGFECPKHVGYHLNFERCFVEIIDQKLVITDLTNTAAPFIRYEVGDMTSGYMLNKEKCECGRSLFTIPDVSGRINDCIVDKEGNIVHAAFFCQIFAKDPAIKQYQVEQTITGLSINIHKTPDFSEEYFLKKYSTLLNNRFSLPCEFIFDKPIIYLTNGKQPMLLKPDMDIQIQR
jgi:phenylacetate-CoA ligase